MNGFCEPDDFADYEPPPNAPDITVEVVERVVVGQLLGPNGEPLIEVFDRAVVPFGFQP